MSEPGRAVFLSYASEDAEAAQRICAALRARGVEVWFDLNELRGGDIWDTKIRQQIKECALFVPLISAHTQARLEGYFRFEWKLAAQRTQTMADEKIFLLPVCLDHTRDAEAKVPAEFKTAQWTFLAGGEPTAAFCARITTLLGGQVAESVATAVTAPATATRDARSVAVLPFANLSRDEENEYFAEGLAEELLNVLARIRGLRVAARTSSFSFKGHNADIRSIGASLNVATVLEGSVRKAGNRVRITAQLIDAANGYHLWSQTYNRELDDIFAVQDDIAQSVVQELQAKLFGTPDSAARLVEAANRGRTSNPEAHRLALLGRFHSQRRTVADMGTAIRHYEQAVALDPGFALGWSGLAYSIFWETAYGGSNAPGAYAAGFARADAAIRRALALEPELPEGLLTEATIRAGLTRNLTGTAEATRKALALAPGDAALANAGTVMLLLNGHLEEALALARQCLEQDPLNSAAYAAIGRIHVGRGDLADAEVAFRQAIEMNPQARVRRYYLGFVLLHQNRLAEAEAAMSAETSPAFRRLGLGLVRWAQGRRAEADLLMQEFQEQHGVGGAYQVADLHAFRGETDAAFEWLERAYEGYDPGIQGAKVDVLLRSLHADARWPVFLRKLGLADEKGSA